MSYDSKADTLLHIKRVSQLLNEAAIKLIERGDVHDNSKLEEPEKGLFDEFTPKLKDCVYGSDEYKGYLNGLKVALDHHYQNNSHHPEHYENGVNGFDLFDLMEMFFDWKAATERTKDGNIFKSIDYKCTFFTPSFTPSFTPLVAIKVVLNYPNRCVKFSKILPSVLGGSVWANFKAAEHP